MKKNILLYALLGLMAVVTSCSKTDETEKPTIPAADLAVWNKVQAFKARMANPLKDGDPLTVDSAVWYIETTLNCTYGDASYEFTDMHTDSAFTTLAVENGQVDRTAVTTAYNQLLDSIRQHYYGLTATDKQFVFANVELIPTGLKTSEVTLKVTSEVAEMDATVALNFGPTDYWYFGNCTGGWGGGKCGPYSGYDDSDAALEITKKARLRLASPANCYFINPQTIEIGPDYVIRVPGDVYDNWCDYYLFNSYSEIPNFHDCLCPDEMNFYLSGAIKLMEDYSLYRPMGKLARNITLRSDGRFPMGYSQYLHWATISFATPVQSVDPPTDL